MHEYNLWLNEVLVSCCPWYDCWNIFFFTFSWSCFLFPDCGLDFCYSTHGLYVAILNAHLSFGVDFALVQSVEICPGFLQQLHVPSLNILSLEIIILFFLFLLSTLVLFLENIMFWCLGLCFYRSKIIIPMIFNISTADIESLGYWLFLFEYWLTVPCTKLSYFIGPNLQLSGTPYIY